MFVVDPLVEIRMIESIRTTIELYFQYKENPTIVQKTKELVTIALGIAEKSKSIQQEKPVFNAYHITLTAIHQWLYDLSRDSNIIVVIPNHSHCIFNKTPWSR